jgi:hypothetical protein
MATIQKILQGRITILEPLPEFGIFIDAEATQPASQVLFGSVRPGEASGLRTVWVKNTGQRDLSNISFSVPEMPTVGEVSFSNNDFPLAVGEVQPVGMEVTVALTGWVLGVHDFDITVTATY